MYYYLIIIYSILTCSFIHCHIHFIHIPKTGGTTVHSILENFFHLDEIYPYRKVQSIHNPSSWKRSFERLPDFNREYENLPNINSEFTSGHFPYWFFKTKDLRREPAFIFTVLRDPVERVLSDLRYRKKSFPQIEVTLEDVEPNWLCYMLCSDPNLPDDELLKDCIGNLNKLDYVMFMDSFEEDLIEVLRSLGIECSEISEIPKYNTTISQKHDENFLDEVRKRNYLDVQLYDYAISNIKNTPKKYNQKFKYLEYLKKPKKVFKYDFAQPLVGKGWSYRENLDTEKPIYRWINGSEGKLIFYFSNPRDCLLTINCKLLIDEMDFVVKINGFPVLLKKYDNQSFSTYKGIIPKEILSFGENKLSFFASKSFIYNQLFPDALDSRTLSIALNTITIK